MNPRGAVKTVRRVTSSGLCQVFCFNLIDSLSVLLSRPHPFFVDSSVPTLSIFYRLFCPSLIDSSVPALSTLLSQHYRFFYRLFCPSLIGSSVPALSTFLSHHCRFFYRLFCPSRIDFLSTLLSQPYRVFCPNMSTKRVFLLL